MKSREERYEYFIFMNNLCCVDFSRHADSDLEMNWVCHHYTDVLIS